MLRFVWVLVLALAAGPLHAGEFQKWTGARTPPLSLKGLDGRARTLASVRGKVVVVNFWATWCEPCRTELPAFDKLREEFGERRLEVWGVNYAEPAQRVRRFLEQVPVGFSVLMDEEGAVSKQWGVRVLPATFVLGTDGRIRYALRGEIEDGGDGLKKVIRELLPGT